MKKVVYVFLLAFLLVGCKDFFHPGGGEGPGTPGVPSGLSVTGQSSSKIAVSWSAVTGVTSYNIYRESSPTGSFTTSVGSSTTTAYTDTGLMAETTYWYRVSAVNGTEGAQSVTESGRTLGITVSTLAGNGSYGYADGPGTSAKFNAPLDVAVDNAGNVYVADHNNARIRKISPTEEVSTLAGSGNGYAEGPGISAKFEFPRGVAVDNAGNVYVADTGNNRIRKINPTGVVSTLAGGNGGGYADGPGTSAKFNSPYGVAVDNAGNVYVADTENHRIRKISPTGIVSYLAGGDCGYAEGTETSAKFNSPHGVAVDNAGNVYVADTENHRIRKISPTGVVSTLAGSGTSGYADGPGTSAKFNSPYGVAVDNADNVYVADLYNNRIRKISPTGVVSNLAGSGAYDYVDGPGTSAMFRYPQGVAVDNAGNVYVADYANYRIRKITQ